MRRLAALLLVLVACRLPGRAQDVFRVYTEHPRLFLRPHRLRLLRKERERRSMRWDQFDAVMRSGAAPPEPGFANALYYEITGDASVARRAIEWALAQGPPRDLRQLALVYDWCQDAMSEPQGAMLARAIRAQLERPATENLSVRRDRILAAIAIAERDQAFTETVLRDAVTVWWRRGFAPTLGSAANPIIGGDLFPLVEILHAVRDNLNIDLREERSEWFQQLPEFHLAAHYPASYPGGENEFRIPAFSGDSEPDLKSAALSRAAGLALVAFDTNALPSQYLQGWLIQDRFLLRAAFGAPYEFLWANPYQPGLAYVHLPLVYYDPSAGTLLVRSSWEEDAAWFGLLNGHMQLFRDGAITAIEDHPAASKSSKERAPASIEMGSALIVQGRSSLRFSSGHDNVFVVGLLADHAYDVEVDDEQMCDMKTDPAGTLAFKFAPGSRAGVRIHPPLRDNP